MKKGAVVQLVRIQACHAWGRGFESRPHRLIKTEKIRKVLRFNTLGLFLFPLTQAKVPESGSSQIVQIVFQKVCIFLVFPSLQIYSFLIKQS